MPTHHLVNISGGKDSAAVALLAAERGMPFRLIMADTGNESPITVEYAHKVADFLGKPLEIFRADFAQRIENKRRYVAEKWPLKGVPQATIDAALSVLVPSGNPFLDLCIWKGRFPSRKAQFCTEFLKQEAINEGAVFPALQTGRVIQWLGGAARRKPEPPRCAHVPAGQNAGARHGSFPPDHSLDGAGCLFLRSRKGPAPEPAVSAWHVSRRVLSVHQRRKGGIEGDWASVSRSCGEDHGLGKDRFIGIQATEIHILCPRCDARRCSNRQGGTGARRSDGRRKRRHALAGCCYRF